MIRGFSYRDFEFGFFIAATLELFLVVAIGLEELLLLGMFIVLAPLLWKIDSGKYNYSFLQPLHKGFLCKHDGQTIVGRIIHFI